MKFTTFRSRVPNGMFPVVLLYVHGQEEMDGKKQGRRSQRCDSEYVKSVQCTCTWTVVHGAISGFRGATLVHTCVNTEWSTLFTETVTSRRSAIS